VSVDATRLAGLGLALVLLGTPANADVAVVYVSSGAPAAAGAREDAVGLAMTDIGGAVPVRMNYERVQIDLYPTLVTVDATFEMHAEADTEELLVAFPERPAGALESKPLLGLRVDVDGQPVALEQGARAFAKCEQFDGELQVFWSTESWWAWSMQAKGGRDYVIRVRYAQLLDPFSTAERIEYVLRTGASWLGPIGRGDIELRLHDLELDEVEVRWPSESEPKDQAPLSWSFEQLEPDEDVVIESRPRLDFRLGEDEHALTKFELPEEPMYELLVRLSLLPWRDSISEWPTILALMNELEQRDEAGRVLVAQLRDELTRELVDRATHYGRLAFAPETDPTWSEASAISPELEQQLRETIERFRGDPNAIARHLQGAGNVDQRCERPVAECVDERPSIANAPYDPVCLDAPMRGLLSLSTRYDPWDRDPLYGLVHGPVAAAMPEAEDRGRAWVHLGLALGGAVLLGFATAVALRRRRAR
jgi:hypothetical protein